MSEGEPSAVWLQYRNDPDNWLRIPEFGVRPDDVDLVGFAYPIIGPFTDADEQSFEQSVRDMVATLRGLARAEFSSLIDLQACKAEGLELLWPIDGAADGPTEEGTAQLSQKHGVALRYWAAMEGFETAIQGRVRSQKEPLKWRVIAERRAADAVASAASLIVAWMAGKPFVAQMEAVTRMKHGASRGGRKSAETRRDNGRLPEPQRLREKRSELIAGGAAEREVAGILAKIYHCTSDHIRKTLKRD